MLVDVTPFSEPDPVARVEKSVWLQVASLLREGLREATRVLPDAAPTVATFGVPAELVAHALRGSTCELVDVAPEQARWTGSAPAAHAAVLLLDEGLDSGGRVSAMSTAAGAVRPGGTLLLVAAVVSPPPGDEVCPRMSQLVEELGFATGGLLHVDDMRSVRWADEPLRRGVFLSMTVLGRSLEDDG